MPLVLLLIAGCHPSPKQAKNGDSTPAVAAPNPVQFTDVTTDAGIHFKHTNGRSGRLYLPETVGAGCGFLDCNRDGKLDLFLVNSSRLPGFAEPGPFYPAL